MKGLKQFFPLLFELTKTKLSLMVTLSGGTGFLLACQGISYHMFPILVGIFLLVAGASTLNQVQERREDPLMERTKNRPIPSGRLSPSSALYISLLFLISGLGLLYISTPWGVYGLGLLAVLIYNGIYTPLKKRSLFAVIPGAMVGAIPPAMGWFSAGGTLQPQILALCNFFFLWQIPHTWLLLLDYRKEYVKAGFAPLLQNGGNRQVKKIVWVWIVATVVCSLLIPIFGAERSLLNFTGLLFFGLLLTYQASKRLLYQKEMDSLRFAFRAVNLYMLWVMVFLNLDRLCQNLFL